MKTNCVIIDNYDSFTYNLVHLIKELGVDVTVVRNNQFSLEDLNNYDRIVLSPGPGVPSEAVVGRYHSWVVEKTNFPDCLEIIAESKEGLIMALRHRTHNIYGIQFHPESVLTPDGKRIMANWLHI